MNQPLPDDIQVMVAGYVLGDLSAEERQQFQQLLADHPELTQDIAALQETLALLPYGSPLEPPDQQLRSRLLLTAEQQLNSPTAGQLLPTLPTPLVEPGPFESSPPPKPFTPRPRPVPHWLVLGTGISRIAALMAVVLGGCSIFLVHRINRLQIQLSIAETAVEKILDGVANDGIVQPSLTFRSSEVGADPTVTIHSASGLFAQQWSGLEHIIQDHVGSLRRSQGPVDIATTDPIRLRNQLRTKQNGPNAQLPVLSIPQATLLGGSPCKFDQTKGLRVTYSIENFSAKVPAPPLSLYQIALKNDLGENQFPTFSDTYITVNYDGVNLVLWRQDDYLYALVSDLPLANLHVLTQMMELI